MCFDFNNLGSLKPMKSQIAVVSDSDAFAGLSWTPLAIGVLPLQLTGQASVLALTVKTSDVASNSADRDDRTTLAPHPSLAIPNFSISS